MDRKCRRQVADTLETSGPDALSWRGWQSLENVSTFGQLKAGFMNTSPAANQ